MKRRVHNRGADATRGMGRKSIVYKHTPKSQPGTTDVREEKKRKEMVGNEKGESLLSSYNSSGLSETSLDLQVGDVSVKNPDFGEGGSQSMSLLSFGSISVMGRSRVMEDALTVAPRILAGDYEFFAVYDGHGGATVAHACRERMHQLVENELKDNLGSKNVDDKGVDWTMIMEACFSKMDEEVQMNYVQNREEEIGAATEKGVGSTAVVVMVGTEELVVANCGDSRAVLCRGGIALPLSNDHKPDRPDEKERVEGAGGRIINWDGSRVQGILATSRSIGDYNLKPYVISKPEMTLKKRTDLDEFVIIATDGLWDVVSNDMACEIVKRCFDGQINNLRESFYGESVTGIAAAILAELAIAKGSSDNISVIVVDVKKPSTRVSETFIVSTSTFQV